MLANSGCPTKIWTNQGYQGRKIHKPFPGRVNNGFFVIGGIATVARFVLDKTCGGILWRCLTICTSIRILFVCALSINCIVVVYRYTYVLYDE